jgi:predicted DNA-binding transcriptional regulator AlpA
MRRPPLPEAAASPSGVIRLVDAIEPLLSQEDLTRVLNASRRTVERIRAAGKLPKPDLHVGNRSPRWRPRTIREWIERGGRP